MAAAGAAPEDGAVADGAVARLWLHAQQRLADRVAHEIRNALNGASVNVAALHGRLERSAELGGRALQLSSLASEELAEPIVCERLAGQFPPVLHFTCNVPLVSPPLNVKVDGICEFESVSCVSNVNVSAGFPPSLILTI